MSLDPVTADGTSTIHQDSALTTTNGLELLPRVEGKTVDALVTHEPVQPEKARDLGTLSWICVVISLLFSMFLFSLDNVIVADIQPNIIKTLGNIEKLPWVSVAYALDATAVNLFVYVHRLVSLRFVN